jgi:antitoxin CcdA
MKREFRETARTFRHSRAASPKAPIARGRGQKRAVNVSVDAEILDAAKAMRINLSQTLEVELRTRVKEERNRKFQEEHREAIASYNRFIEEHGIWSKKYRKW